MQDERDNLDEGRKDEWRMGGGIEGSSHDDLGRDGNSDQEHPQFPPEDQEKGNPAERTFYSDIRAERPQDYNRRQPENFWQDFHGGDSRPGNRRKGIPGGAIIALSMLIILIAVAVTVFYPRVLESGKSVLDLLPIPTQGQPAIQPPRVTSPVSPEPLIVSGENSIPTAPVGSGLTMTLAGTADADELSLQEIYLKCAPSVVAIMAEVDLHGYNWGTGIILSEDGYIITNSHVLDGSRSVVVKLYDNSEYEGLLVGYDALSDLAVLKIDAQNLTAAEFGDSSKLLVGDDVIAIGNPLGDEFRGTMTDGIISAINRDITYNGHMMTLLQTNAAINEGNSGGPLINMHGQVIGITNMKMISYYSSVEGIGFAIPTSSMKAVVDELIEKGYVSNRAAIGITVSAIPQTLENYDELPEGIYIADVKDNSDAYEKGIRKGDIIVAANGETVVTAAELNAIKDTLNVFDTLILTIYRNGEIFDVEVVLHDMHEF